MHVKPAKSPPRRNGMRHTYYLLVQSVRGPDGKPRHKVLLTIGKLDGFSREERSLLGRRVTALVEGTRELFPCDNPKVERKAREIAERLVAKWMRERGQRVSLPGEKEEVVPVVLDRVSAQHSRSIGAEYVVLSAYRLLGLDEMLREMGFTERQREVAALVLVARALDAGSERSTLRWVKRESALEELLGADFQRLSPKTVYQIADRLLAVKEELEDRLRQRERSLFGLEETVVLYDLTNTYFEGEARGSEKARRGHSKDKRHDRPLLTLGLVLDGEGFVKTSRLFAGNQAEPATLLEMVEALERATPAGAKPTVVIDAGIATEENLAMLRERGYTYIAVSRRRFEVFDDQAEGVAELRSEPNRVEARLIRRGEEVILVCHSQGREAKERAMRKLQQERFEALLDSLRRGLARPQTTKRVDKVWQRIGRFRERYPSVAQFYEIEVREENGKAVDVRYRIRDEEALEGRFAGRYFLRTNCTEWDAQVLWRTYVLLTDVEDTFRTLKSEIGLRPNFHQKTERVEGHAFLSVLAYHLVHAIRFRLSERGVRHRWALLRRIFSTQRRVTVRLVTDSGRAVYVRTTTDPTDEQRWLYQLLGLEPLPLPAIKLHP